MYGNCTAWYLKIKYKTDRHIVSICGTIAHNRHTARQVSDPDQSRNVHNSSFMKHSGKKFETANRDGVHLHLAVEECHEVLHRGRVSHRNVFAVMRFTAWFTGATSPVLFCYVCLGLWGRGFASSTESAVWLPGCWRCCMLVGYNTKTLRHAWKSSNREVKKTLNKNPRQNQLYALDRSRTDWLILGATAITCTYYSVVHRNRI